MTEGVIAYRIMSLVGEGGFGKVYRARQESREGFAKEVALKVLTDDDPPKSLLARFRDEARILGLLRDRAIVRVEPPVLIGGRWAVVMEFIDGVSLGALIGQHHGVPPGVAIEIVGEVARALHNAYHTRNDEGEELQLLHRDIKPDNIQVTPSGEVRLLDFGIARANFAQREVKTRRSFGGTPGYIAPERPEGIEVAAGDVYSLGILLHEAIVGTRPKGAVSLEFVDDLPRIDTEELDLPEGLSADQRKVIELAAWMRAYEHDQRPSARQVEELCRSLRTQLGAPFLRDWAEHAVPHRVELEPDDRVGLLQEVMSTGTPAPAERMLLPQRAPTADGPTTAAIGGMVASGLGLGLVLGVAIMSIVAGGAVWFLFSDRPLAEPVIVDIVVPEPEPEPEPEPVPMPEPPPPPPKPKVIHLDGTRPKDEPVAAPSPKPTAPAPDARSTGWLVVRTIPTGGYVSRSGQRLPSTGNRYPLPEGSHSLQLVSPSGETAPLNVVIHADENNDVCYSFDNNAPCSQ